MKTVQISLVAVVVLMSMAARANGIVLTNTEAVNLASSENEMSISTPYPGATISGICELEIRADSYTREKPLQLFLDAVVINGAFHFGPKPVQVANAMSAFFKLLTGAYTDGIHIKTKDGKSLKANIQRTMGFESYERRVVVLGVTCR